MRRFILHGCGLAIILTAVAMSAWGSEDTPKAAETRKLLQQKVSVDFSDTALTDAVDELKSQVSGLTFQIDAAGGVSKNIKIKYKGDGKTVAEVLDGMFKKNGLGYIVVSKKGTAYDGIVRIKQGKERGYAPGDRPSRTSESGKEDASDQEKPAGKTIAKAKPNKAKDAPPAKPASEEKPVDDADKAEHDAATKLGFAKTLAEDGKRDKAKQWLEDLIAKYPSTKAATEAKALLKKLEQ